MKTISNLPGGRFLVAAALFLFALVPVFGQIFSHTRTAPNAFEFKISLPDLPRNGITTSNPNYEVYVHFGDGNIGRFTPDRNGVSETGLYKFRPLIIPYTYLLNGAYHPTFSLTAKYTPPSPPKRGFIAPPDDFTVTGAIGVFVQSTALLGGRSIAVDTNHRVPYAMDGQATFAIIWNREPAPPGNKVVVFHGGLRDNSDNLKAASMVTVNNKPIMAIHAENPTFPAQADATQRTWVTASANNGPTTSTPYVSMENRYDSAFIIPSLTGGAGEGRFFLNFRNRQELIFTDQKISIFGVILTEKPERTTAELESIGNIKQLFSLGLQPDPDNNAFRVGDGYIYDWFLYEERPVYIHDPNELTITKMTKNGAGDYDLLLDYTSCSHYKSNNPATYATVIFDRTELVPGSLAITGAEHGTTILGMTDLPSPMPPGYFFRKRITGMALQPGECFTMHFKGILPAAKAHLAHVDGKILHGCVELENESNADPVDVCRWNTKIAGPKGPETNDTPCGKPGFWNQIKCLCTNSPIPCWIIILIVLALLLWLFFKKKN